MGDVKPDGKVAADHLRKLADNIEKIQLRETVSIQFDFSELESLLDNKPVKKIADIIEREHQSIYSFHLDKHASKDKLYEVFKHAKENKLNGLAYARVNKESQQQKFCDCFYVGSSRNTIARLEQHLGLRAPTTYSLQMKHWANGLNGGFEICVHKFKLDTEKLKLLPYLEDQFAWELNPMFGRRGSL